MTVYILTEQEHAQLLDVLTRINRVDDDCDILSPSLANDATEAEDMLDAMKPVSPTFYMSKHQNKPRFYREAETLPTNVVSLYTPTKY